MDNVRSSLKQTSIIDYIITDAQLLTRSVRECASDQWRVQGGRGGGCSSSLLALGLILIR